MQESRTRPRRTLALGAAGAVAALLLAGCTSEPLPAGESTPASESQAASTPTPTQLSEDEALAIAVETYEAYLAASGEVYERGEQAADEFNAVATGKFAETELSQLVEIAESGDWVAEGQIKVVKAQIQRIDPGSIALYLCTDASEARLYQVSDGPAPTRDQVIFTLEVGLVKDDDVFKVNRSDPWNDPSFCAEYL